jgi:elongin-C
MISSLVLEKVCEYFYYYQMHKDAKDVPDLPFEPAICLELLIAADYLKSKLDDDTLERLQLTNLV